MGLYGSLVSLDAEGQHEHPLEEDTIPHHESHWLAAFSHRVMAALHRLMHR
jgi:hypothetical protein